MKNDADIGINDNEDKQKPAWPREVCIRQTLDSIAAELGDDYDEDDNNGMVAAAIIDSMSTIEIESWDEIPDGYELYNDQDREARLAYLDSKQHEDTEVIHHASQKPSSDGIIEAIDLQHGKFYDCTIDTDHGSKETDSFVQLAIDAKTNRRWMLFGKKSLLEKHTDLVRKLINMSFDDLVAEDYEGSPDSVRGLQLQEFILDAGGALHDKSDDCYLSHFKSSGEIKQPPSADSH